MIPPIARKLNAVAELTRRISFRCDVASSQLASSSPQGKTMLWFLASLPKSRLTLSIRTQSLLQFSNVKATTPTWSLDSSSS
jgi:hypothetical protein